MNDLEYIYTTRKMNDLDYIHTARMMKYVEDGCFRQLKALEFDQVNNETITKIKNIVNKYLDIAKSSGIIPNNIVLHDVIKNSNDDTQVEIIFSRGDYKSSIYM